MPRRSPLHHLAVPATTVAVIAVVVVGASLAGLFGHRPAPRPSSQAVVEVPAAPTTTPATVASTGTCAQAQAPLKAFMAAHTYAAVRSDAALSTQYSTLAAAGLSSTACTQAEVTGFEQTFQFPWLAASASALPVVTVPAGPPTTTGSAPPGQAASVPGAATAPPAGASVPAGAAATPDGGQARVG